VEIKSCQLKKSYQALCQTKDCKKQQREPGQGNLKRGGGGDKKIPRKGSETLEGEGPKAKRENVDGFAGGPSWKKKGQGGGGEDRTRAAGVMKNKERTPSRKGQGTGEKKAI